MVNLVKIQFIYKKVKGIDMSNTQKTKYFTIQDDNFRYQTFNKNKERFNVLQNQLMAYNSIVQNEMIFTLEQVDEMENNTLKALEDMKQYIMQQRQELNDKFVQVDNVDEYQKKIDKKYECSYY